jgi:hypothetical protein
MGRQPVLVEVRAVRAASIVQEGGPVAAPVLDHRVQPGGAGVLQQHVCCRRPPEGVVVLCVNLALLDHGAILYDLQRVRYPASDMWTGLQGASYISTTGLPTTRLSVLTRMVCRPRKVACRQGLRLTRKGLLGHQLQMLPQPLWRSSAARRQAACSMALANYIQIRANAVRTHPCNRCMNGFFSQCWRHGCCSAGSSSNYPGFRGCCKVQAYRWCKYHLGTFFKMPLGTILQRRLTHCSPGALGFGWRAGGGSILGGGGNNSSSSDAPSPSFTVAIASGLAAALASTGCILVSCTECFKSWAASEPIQALCCGTQSSKGPKSLIRSTSCKVSQAGYILDIRV